MPEPMIENDKGERMVVRNGQWVPLSQAEAAPQQSPGVVYGARPPAPRPQVAPPGLAEAVAPGGPGILGPNGSYTAPRAAPEVDPKDAARAEKQLADQRRAAEILRETVQDALQRLNRSQDRFSLGPFKGDWETSLLGTRGWVDRRIPGSDAAVFDGVLDTIRGNTAIERLNEMKSHSATGASGFGALSAPELTLLTSLMGSLDPNKNDLESMQTTLRRIDELTARAFPDETPAVSDAPQIDPEPARASARRDASRIRRSGPSDADIARLMSAGPAAAPALAAALAQRNGTARRPAPRRSSPAKPIGQMSDEELARIARGG